ncbi:hypothetical protein V1511DRAFT_508138 [Dipodascopsis uninucleata]
MDSSSAFASVPLRSGRSFSAIFLIELVVTGIVAIFILFYFNRVIGTIVSLSFRWYTWHKYHVFVDIRSVQVSFLAGRIFFRDLRYIGSNETIFAVQGHFTWRYWLSRTRESDIDVSSKDRDRNSALPARFALYITGLEWFVYNRTDAYEAAFRTQQAAMSNNCQPQGPTDDSAKFEEEKAGASSLRADSAHTKRVKVREKETSDTITYKDGISDDTIATDNGSNGEKEGLSRVRNSSGSRTDESFRHIDHKEVREEQQEATIRLSRILRLFPVEIQTEKGAMVVGNYKSPTVLIYHFQDAIGTVDTSRSRSPLDMYKMVYDFKFTSPHIQMKANLDYRESDNTQIAEDEVPASKNAVDLKKTDRPSKLQSLLDMVSFLFGRRGVVSNTDEGLPRPVESEAWHGLSRYLDEDDLEIVEEEDVIEYAKCTSILEADEARFTYYYDIAGKVPFNPLPMLYSERDTIDIGNGGLPPQYGMDLSLSGATIQYGPWADRQRVILQSLFYPSVYVDSCPCTRLQSGQDRVATEFRFYIELDDSSIMRIPIREPSRESEYKKRKKEVGGNFVRSFGWIEIKMSELSTIAYSSAMVPTTSGFYNWFVVDLNNPELRSSVNHDILWTSTRLSIKGDISSPLKWNGLQSWEFSIESDDIKCFLLREHVSVLTDMIDDFASGPDIPYETFLPRIYTFNFRFREFSLFLNVNDSNIISNPTDFEDNTFLDFNAPVFEISVTVPMDQISPSERNVSYSMNAETVNLLCNAPSWNTQASFANTDTLGLVIDFELNGSYSYTTLAHSVLFDTIILNISTSKISLIAYGHIIRYFITIRENYFGENIHFRTLDEFNSGLAEQENELKRNINPEESENSEMSVESDSAEMKDPLTTDILVTFSTSQGCLIFPTNIYSTVSHARLYFDMLDVDMRFTNYYMDLYVNISPIHGMIVELPPDKILNTERSLIEVEGPAFYIDGGTIHGHRMFGLPPLEPTYMCNWDFDFGLFFAEGSPSLLDSLSDALSVYAFTFSDKENALILGDIVLHDITLLRLNLASFRVLVHTPSSTFEVLTDPIKLTLNDFSLERYNSKLSLSVPSLSVLCRDRLVDPADDSCIHGFFTTSLYVTNFDRKKYGLERLRLQQAHVQKHDRPFQRTTMFEINDNYYEEDPAISKSLDITMPCPKMPFPLVKIAPWDQHSTGYNLSNTSLSSVIHHDTSMRSAHDGNEEYSGSYKSREFSSNCEKDILMASTFVPPYACVSAFKQTKIVRDALLNSCSHSFDNNTDTDAVANNPLEDSDTGTDSFIIELRSGVHGISSPLLIEKLLEVMDILSKPKAEVMIDALQMNVIKRLESNLCDISQITSIIVSIPGVHIKHGMIDNIITETSIIPEKIQLEDHMDLISKSISLNIRFTDRSEFIKNENLPRQNLVTRHISFYFSFFDFNLGLVPKSFTKGHAYIPLELQVEQLEVWTRTSEKDSGCLRIKTFSLTKQASEIKWILSALIDIARPLEEFVKKFEVLKKRNSTRTKLLVYSIVAASGVYKIAHDPPLLTRPAYTLRSSKSHIRVNDSWKLMVRLRHIFGALPIDIVNGIRRDLTIDDIIAPPDAKSKVIDILHEWRNWELTDISNTYIFNNVFDGETIIRSMISDCAHMLFELESFTINLVNNFDQIDYVQLSYPSISLVYAGSNSPPIVSNEDSLASDAPPVDTIEQEAAYIGRTLKISFGCEDIRYVMSFDTISLFKEIKQVLGGINNLPFSRTTSELTCDKSSGTSSTDDPICIHAIVAIRSSLAVLNAHTLKLQLSSHNIKSSSLFSFDKSRFIDQVSSALSTPSLEIDILDILQDNERQLASAAIQDMRLCVSRDMRFSNTLKTTFKMNELMFNLFQDLISLSSIVESIAKDELTQIQSLILSPSENKSVPLQSMNSKSIVDDVSIQIGLDRYRILLNLLPSLKYAIRGNSIKIVSTAAINHVRLLAIEAGEQVHDFRRRTNSRDSGITALQIPKIGTILRVEDINSELRALDARINVHTADLDASSVPTLAAALAGDVTKAEVKNAEKGWLKASQALNLAMVKQSSTGKSVAVERHKHLKLRGSLYIESVAIKVRASGATLVLQMANIKLEGRSTLSGAEKKDVLDVLHNSTYSGILPDVQVYVIHKKFTSGRFQILATDLAISAKGITEDNGSPRQSLAMRTRQFYLTASPLSVMLLVDILSKFEEQLTNIDLPQELFHLTGKQNQSNVTKSDNSEQLNQGKFIDAIFRVLLRVQITRPTISWVSDELNGSRNDSMPSFIIEVSSSSVSVLSRGEQLLLMSVRGFSVKLKEKSPGKSYKTGDKEVNYSSSVMSEISVSVSVHHEEHKRSLSLDVKSSEVNITIIPSIVKVFYTMSSAITDTMKSVTEKIENYRMRSSSNSSEFTSSDSMEIPYESWLLKSALVTAHFAGSTIELIGDAGQKYTEDQTPGSLGASQANKLYVNDSGAIAMLKVPGVRLLSNYRALSSRKQLLNAEIYIESSVNTLYPRLMPVAMEMVRSFQDMIREPKSTVEIHRNSVVDITKPKDENTARDVLGNLELNIGIMLGRQEFSLSCHPIARIAATVLIEELYIAINSADKEQNKFFSTSCNWKNFSASLQHIYSRESSGEFELKEVVLSALRNERFNRDHGTSFVGKVTDMALYINIRQSHDLLLFQDIWSPDMIMESTRPTKKTADERAELLVQRYHRVASTNAYPWNVDFQILNTRANVDLGQSLGKLTAAVAKVWVASRKSSDWEQNLTFGICDLSIDGDGRLGGNLTLDVFHAQFAIKWQLGVDGQFGVPLVQATTSLGRLESKIYFDYRLFLIAFASSVNLVMFNQRGKSPAHCDRLVCVGNFDAIRVYLTVLAPSNFLAILTSIKRLKEERVASYNAILRDASRFKVQDSMSLSIPRLPPTADSKLGSIELRTQLDLSVKSVVVHVFPSSLADTDVLRLEATRLHAGFGMDTAENNKIESHLALKLGQLLVALSGAKEMKDKDFNQLSVSEFIKNANESKGGTILKIPTVSIMMKTWQPISNTTTVEFIYKCFFEGRIDVGWNLGSINAIRAMWNTHARAFQVRKLASADGTSKPQMLESEELEKRIKEVELSQLYTYIPLEPPIIATPQLRDMGEATPPLEWIGLNRERFPDITHQIIIIALQSSCRKVELAYTDVLGKA